jgi:hypothetical protein
MAKNDSSYIHIKHPTKRAERGALEPPWLPLCESTPLCGSTEPKPLLFYALRGALANGMSARLCPKCADHPDFPLLLLGEA